MRWIYLSPHLDDAVLSAGGLIYEQKQAGFPVEIWTFMSGFAAEDDVSPLAQLLHAQWGFSSAEETTRKRREEDEHAAAVLGAKTLHFDFLDCIYRRGTDGEWLYLDIYAPPHPEDAALPQQIAETISARLQPDDVLVCNLAIGSHVDHVIVRQGAEMLGRTLLYTIDMPYVLYHPEALEPKSTGMRESIHLITKTGLSLWQQAALEYKSQIGALGEAFDTPERAQESIQAYWEERKGISLLQNS
jgi:LmbE family N-acetylglucosaminyl deacetylase